MTGASVPLSPRQASLLAYSAGWVSGLLLLVLESREREVRWHAAQSFLGFGLLTLLAGTLLLIGAVSLFSSIAVFRACVWAAQGIVVAGVVLWLTSLVQVARGRRFRWPLIARRVEQLAALGEQSAPARVS